MRLPHHQQTIIFNLHWCFNVCYQQKHQFHSTSWCLVNYTLGSGGISLSSIQQQVWTNPRLASKVSLRAPPPKYHQVNNVNSAHSNTYYNFWTTYIQLFIFATNERPHQLHALRSNYQIKLNKVSFCLFFFKEEHYYARTWNTFLSVATHSWPKTYHLITWATCEITCLGKCHHQMWGVPYRLSGFWMFGT